MKMDKRHRRAIIAATIITTLSFISSLHAAEEKKTKPNILFIFADDQTYEAIGALGNTVVQTPNLDSIMHNGVHFTHAYNMGAWGGAVCVASRAMLNSGKFVNRSKAGLKKNPHWSELMRNAGYKTYMTGKWHVPGVRVPRFDVVKDVRPGMPNQTPSGYDRPKSMEDYKNGWKPWDKSKGGYWKGGTHWSKVVADNAINFIDDAKNQDKPFFMYIAFNAPHDPRQSPKEYVDMYPLDSIKVPRNFVKEYKYKDAMGCSKRLRDEHLAPFPRTEFAVKVQRQEYYAAVTYMDYNIGRILKALKESGQADNTYIAFTADHGIAVGHHGLMGKQNAYEDSIKVPLAIAGPGIPRNVDCNSFVYLHDLNPTICELAGVTPPKGLHARSILPLLKNPQKTVRPVIYSCYDTWRADPARPFYIAFDKDGNWHKEKTPKGQRYEKRGHMRTVREGDWKLLINLYDGKVTELLFNLKDDPLETTDLSHKPESKAIIARLKSKLPALMQDAGDPADFSDPLRWGFKPPPGI
jgi:choline-sulfatase